MSRRPVLTLAAGGVLAMSIAPLAPTGPAHAGPAPAQVSSAVAAPDYGYSTTAWSTPVKVEVYEPTIPLPATPQLELEVGYTEVLADSASSRGRASYLWPGGPVGEGFKTIGEQLGLPAELTEGGYPIQVNAAHPAGPEEHADEPGPGMVQRAVASEGFARADNGFSGDGEVEPDGDGGGDGGGGLPGLPSLPGLPGLPSGGLLGSLGSSAGAPQAPTATPALPPELAALLDVGGFTSMSQTNNTERAGAQSKAKVGDVTLLGGLVTMKGFTTEATVTSDGKKGKADGRARYGDIIALGQRFSMGPNGYEAAGQAGPLPIPAGGGAAALEQLGVKVIVPKAKYVVKGDAATATVPGAIIEFDLSVLKKRLDAIPLGDIIGMLPDQAGELKNLLFAAVNLSPRIVFHLATATASVDTSPPIDLPDVEAPEPEEPEETVKEGDAAPPAAATPPGSSGPAPSDAPIAEAAPADALDGLLPTSGPAGPGLPPLFSIPGMLLLGALLGAALGGSYLRRLGLAALGGSGSCPHGLESGVPDLRRMS